MFLFVAYLISRDKYFFEGLNILSVLFAYALMVFMVFTVFEKLFTTLYNY
jgi:hypothetical protein